MDCKDGVAAGHVKEHGLVQGVLGLVKVGGEPGATGGLEQRQVYVLTARQPQGCTHQG